MVSDLKSLLEADLGADKVSIELVPVDSSDGKPKVYKIELNGETYYDWSMSMADGKPDIQIAVAPNENWKTPLNFATHGTYFGEGPKTELIQELKAAITSKC